MAGVAGPFREGAELFLSCQVSGGKFRGGSIDWGNFSLQVAISFSLETESVRKSRDEDKWFCQ